MPSVSKFQQSRSLPNSAVAQSVLSILHDHAKLAKLQPIVGQIEPLPSAPDRAHPDERSSEYEWFRQTEYVPFLPFGIWKQKVVFENYYKDLADTPVQEGSEMAPSDTEEAASTATTTTTKTLYEGGVESKVYAPAGLQIKAVFRVVRRRSDPRKDTLRKRDVNEKADEISGGWRLEEETEMTSRNPLIRLVSVGQHQSAQKKMLNNILFEARKRTYGAAAVEGAQE